MKGDGVRRAAEAWERFWFGPTSTSTLAVVRIAYGLIILAWALSLAPDLRAFFMNDGILPEQPQRDWYIGLLQLVGSDTAVVALYAVFLVAALCLMVGYRTRLAALLTFLALISFQRRNPYIDNAGDGLLRVLGFYLLLAPSGVALSVDRWRKARDSFWVFPERAPWAIRLVQIQLSVVYLFTVWDKARGDTWSDGTAVAYALRVEALQRAVVPEALVDNLLLMNLLTWGTLVVELALAVLVWNRALRPLVLILGVALHLFIDITLMVGFFSLAMYVMYIAFVPTETMARWILVARDRWRERKVEQPEPPEPDLSPGSGATLPPPERTAARA